MPPVLDRALAHLLLIVIGVALIYAAKQFGAWYRPRYEEEFRQNAGQRMGWDVLWMIVTRRAPILYVFFGPLLGWILIALGAVQLIELALRRA
jgi:hypothetical protein